ncbi:MAG: fibrinogen-like YCDxxxxGGGW domain-containing protein, partial [Myxococcota bacterium]|nr:fibrinogen-like YCDxxxxGGGW domain-containing protein [Myxococcota bacterium]
MGCESAWNYDDGGGMGRVCIVGTAAPFWSLFDYVTEDICGISTEASYLSGAPCTEDRRFAIFVRRPTCGDGVVDVGEACDDQNTDELDGCTSDCQLLAQGLDCTDILEQNPGSPSGDYVIDPTGGGPFVVYCDMETQGGGWSRIFLADTANHASTNIAYTLDNLALRDQSNEVLIGFLDTDTGTVVDEARLALPSNWVQASPMDWPGLNEEVSVRVGDALTPIDTLLRYGSGSLSDCIEGDWGASGGVQGAICFATTAPSPWWAEFADDTPDMCGNNSCETLRFVIQIRRKRCGDGSVSDGEECDDQNDDALDGCSSQCLVATQGLHCLHILETFTELGRPTPSGDYVINPAGTGDDEAVVAACDMETYGGGWTRVFHALTDDYDPDDPTHALAYDVTFRDQLRIDDVTNVLMGFAPEGQPWPSDGWATFPMPKPWDWMEFPMTHDGWNEDISIALGFQQQEPFPFDGEIWFGNDAFVGTTCGQGWDGTAVSDVGMVCIAGTTAPAWYGFGGAQPDRCTTSNVVVDYDDPTQACSADKRFALWLRPSVCGNDKVEAGEECDGDNTPEHTACSHDCMAYVPAESPDCLAILQAHPEATTGDYLIDPDGPDGEEPITVHCEMTARGGGWTRLYVSPDTSLYSTTRDYDVTAQALRSTEVSVMMALDEAGTLTHQTVFQMPQDWVDASPMTYDRRSVPVYASVDLNGGSLFDMTTLHYGFDNFSGGCDGEWANGWSGRICVTPTDLLLDPAPFYARFNAADADTCGLAVVPDDGGTAQNVDCTPDHRFAIYVRQPVCGDGHLDP